MACAHPSHRTALGQLFRSGEQHTLPRLFLTAESGSLNLLAVPGLLGCSSGLRGTFGLKLPGPNQPLRPLGQLLCDLSGHLTNPLKTLNSIAKLYLRPQAFTEPAFRAPVCSPTSCSARSTISSYFPEELYSKAQPHVLREGSSF